MVNDRFTHQGILKISALIPTYNRRNHIFRAIDSVLAQTVPVDEIVVVDDGSTDGTANAIRTHYGDGVALLTQPNSGVAAARNRGVREAHGDWIAFLDSDDLWSPTKLECQIEAITALGPEFGACFTDCSFIGNPHRKSSAFEEAGLEPDSLFKALDDSVHYLLAKRAALLLPALLTRRSLLLELNGFDESMMVAEDTDMLFRLSFKTRFCYVSEPLVKVDRSPSRTVGLVELFAGKSDRIFACRQHMYSKWLSLPELGDGRIRRHIEERRRSWHYTWLITKLCGFRFAGAIDRIRELRARGETRGMIIMTLLSRLSEKLRVFFQRRPLGPITGVSPPTPRLSDTTNDYKI